MDIFWSERIILRKQLHLMALGALPLVVSQLYCVEMAAGSLNTPDISCVWHGKTFQFRIQFLIHVFRKMSPTTGDETSRGRNPQNGRRRDFGRRRHRQSGFQHTGRPRPSSPELFNKDQWKNCYYLGSIGQTIGSYIRKEIKFSSS